MGEADEQLERISRAVAGDPHALEGLLLDSYDRLERRIDRKLPATLRGQVSAEDVLQETFVAVFLDIGSFQPRGRGSFYRWLATIAEHRLQDAIKRHRAAKRGGGRQEIVTPPAGADDSLDQIIDLLAGSRHTPSQSVARHEAAGVVQDGLESLPEDYRQALELRYVQGLPVAEVASTMKRTPRAVHNLCHRGLRTLRARLGRSTQFFWRR